MDYVGFTNRHLFQRITEHTNSRAREWRHHSDKQTGMVDDFENFFKGKSRCS